MHDAALQGQSYSINIIAAPLQFAGDHVNEAVMQQDQNRKHTHVFLTKQWLRRNKVNTWIGSNWM